MNLSELIDLSEVEVENATLSQHHPTLILVVVLVGCTTLEVGKVVPVKDPCQLMVRSEFEFTGFQAICLLAASTAFTSLFLFNLSQVVLGKSVKLSLFFLTPSARLLGSCLDLLGVFHLLVTDAGEHLELGCTDSYSAFPKTLIPGDFVQERVLRKISRFILQTDVPSRQTLIVNRRQSLPRLLLLLDFVLKLAYVEDECVNFGRPLNKDLAFQICPEDLLFGDHACFEFRMGDRAPRPKNAIQLLAVQSVTHVGLAPGLPLVHAEIELPSFPHGLNSEHVGLLLEESVEAAFLLLHRLLQVFAVVFLALDGHVHFDEPVFATGRVLVVIQLVLGHVATAHAVVLSDQLLVELSVETVEGHLVCLN